jgi:hypothetical protein
MAQSREPRLSIERLVARVRVRDAFLAGVTCPLARPGSPPRFGPLADSLLMAGQGRFSPLKRLGNLGTLSGLYGAAAAQSPSVFAARSLESPLNQPVRPSSTGPIVNQISCRSPEAADETLAITMLAPWGLAFRVTECAPYRRREPWPAARGLTAACVARPASGIARTRLRWAVPQAFLDGSRCDLPDRLRGTRSVNPSAS